jgi:rhodanese-related sulfurtransferase
MKLRASLTLLIATAIVAFAVEAPKIAPTEAAKLVADGKAVLVDVREANEWAETGVAAPAVLLAKSDFDGAQKEWKPFLEKNAGKEIILYCRSGKRAGVIGSTLAEKGIKVANAGGLKDWSDAGLPVRKIEAKKP